MSLHIFSSQNNELRILAINLLGHHPMLLVPFPKRRAKNTNTKLRQKAVSLNSWEINIGTKDRRKIIKFSEDSSEMFHFLRPIDAIWQKLPQPPVCDLSCGSALVGWFVCCEQYLFCTNLD